jgi:hypothetical protein
MTLDDGDIRYAMDAAIAILQISNFDDDGFVLIRFSVLSGSCRFCSAQRVWACLNAQTI